jgi:hypothetical protein
VGRIARRSETLADERERRADVAGVCGNGDALASIAMACPGHDVVDAPVKLAPTLGVRVLF